MIKCKTVFIGFLAIFMYSLKKCLSSSISIFDGLFVAVINFENVLYMSFVWYSNIFLQLLGYLFIICQIYLALQKFFYTVPFVYFCFALCDEIASIKSLLGRDLRESW